MPLTRKGEGEEIVYSRLEREWITLENNKKQYKYSNVILAFSERKKYYANIFTAVMQNAKQLEAAYESLSNSAGSANAEEEAYMDSLAGKINALKESLTRITIHTINSDMFKGLVDGATKGINAVDKFIQKFGGIGSAVMVTIPMLTTFNKSISTITKGFTSSIPVIGNWQSKIQTSLGKQSEVITNAKDKMDKLKKTVADGTTSYNEASKGMANYQKQIAGATAKTLALQVAQSTLNMAIGVGISALIGGAIASIQKYLDYIKFTDEEVKQLADSNTKLSESMQDINSKDNLVNKYKDLNNQLKNTNETSQKTKELQEEINKVRSQLATDSGYADIVNNENLSLEKQIELLETAQKKKILDNAYEIKDNLPSKKAIEKELKAMENYIKSYEQYKDMLNTPPDKNGMITWLDDFGTAHEITYSSIKENMDLYSRKLMESKEKVDTYNDSLVKMGEYGLTTTRVQAEYPSVVNKIVDSLLNATDGAAQADKGLKNLSSAMRETSADTETLIKDLNDIKTPDWDLGKITGHLDLSQVSNELVKVTEETKDAQDAMEKYLGIFDEIGGQISNIDDIVGAINEAGGITDEILDQIIATGDAELIAIADNENALQDYLNLKQKDIDMKKEARDKAIEQANAEVEGRNKVLEQVEKEKQAQEELNALREKYRSLSMTKDGKVVSSTGMEVKQFSKVIQGVEDTKKAIIDLDGQMSLVTFDKDGKLTGEFVKVKEVAENMFSVIQQNATGDKIFSLTIDSNGNEIKTELEAVTEAIDGTYVAVTELNGEKVTVNFNDSGEIVGEVGKVVDRFDGLKESIIEINGTKFSMTIDAEGNIVTPLKEIQTSIDGTIQKVEEVNGRKVILSLGDDGVFREDIEATNNLIDNFKDNIENLNGKSIEINIDGSGQLASDLREVTQETDGVYNAIATINGQAVRIRIDEDGNLLEVIEELGFIQQAASDTQYAFESIGGGWTVTNADGVMTWIWNVHDGLDGLKIGMGEINETPIRVEFDENGNYKIQELQWNLDGLLETTQVIDGKTVICTYDLNGNLIEQKEVVSEVNELLDSTNGKEASATANIDTNEAEQKAQTINEELTEINEKSAEATIEVENNGSVEKVEEAKESIESIDGKEAQATVNVDSDQANVNLDNTKQNIEETKDAGKQLEENVVKPTVDTSTAMDNLKLLRRAIQQTKEEANKPIVVRVKENGISNVIGLLKNLLDRINNARIQAGNPITITTVRKEVTQYSTTENPTSTPSKRSMPEQIAERNTIQEATSGDVTEGSNDSTTAVTSDNKDSSKSTDTSSSTASEISELNDYYKAIGNYTPILKNYNQELQKTVTTETSNYKRQIDKDKVVEDLVVNVDRFKDLNSKIQQIIKEIEKNRALQKNASKEQLAELIKAEQELLEKQKDAYEKLKNELKKEQDELKTRLTANWFEFDTEGNISNYEDALKKLEKWANEASGEEKERRKKVVEDLIANVDRYYDLINDAIPDADKNIINTSNDIHDIIMNQELEKIEAIKKASDVMFDAIKRKFDELDYQKNVDGDSNADKTNNYYIKKLALIREQIKQAEEDLAKYNAELSSAVTAEAKAEILANIKETEDGLLSYKDMLQSTREEYQKWIIEMTQTPYRDKVWQLGTQQMNKIIYELEVIGESDATKKLQLMAQQMEIQQGLADEAKKNYENLIYIRDNAELTADAQQALTESLKEAEEQMHNANMELHQFREEYQKYLLQVIQSPYKDKVWQLGTQQMNKIVYELEVIGETDATRKLQLMVNQLEIQKNLSDEAKKNYENLIYIRDNVKLTADAYQELIKQLMSAEEEMHNQSMSLHQLKEEYQKYLLQTMYTPYRDKMWQLGTQQMNKIEYKLEILDEDDTVGKMELLEKKLALQQQMVDETQKYFNQLAYTRDNVKLTADAYQELIKQMMSTQETMHDQSVTLQQLKKEMEDMAKDAIKEYINQLKELEKLQMEQRHEEEINALGSTFFKVSEEEYNKYKKIKTDAINAEIESLKKKLALDSNNLALQQQLKGLQIELYDLQNENYADIQDWYKLSESIHNANIEAIEKELKALEEQDELEKEREERLKRQNELLEAQQKIENIKKNKNIRQLKKDENGEWNFEYTYDKKELADANKDYQDKLESLAKWETELEKDKYKKKLEELKKHEKEALEALKEMHDKQLEELEKKHEAEKESLDKKYDDMLDDTDKYLKELKRLYGDNWAKIMQALSKKLDDGKADLTEFKQHTITEANEATKALNALMDYINKIDGTTITIFQEIKPVEPSKAMSSKMVNVDSYNITPSNAGGDTNNYNIQASFPNATSSDEIERALLNIDTIAKQRIQNK